VTLAASVKYMDIHKIKYEKRKKAFALLRLVNCTIYKFLKSVKLNIKIEGSIYTGIVFYHFSKLYSLSRACYYLIQKNYYNEVDILLRSFFDTYVNMNFISKKPELRSLLYQLDELQFQRDIHEYSLKYVQEKEKENIKIELKRLGKEINKILIEIRQFDPNKDYKKFRWNKISIEDKCDELGIKYEYYFLFKILTKNVHPSSSTASKYLKIKDDVAYYYDYSKIDDGMIEDRILFLVEYLLDASYFVYNEFDLKRFDSILSIDNLKKLGNYFNKISSLKS